MRSTDARMAKYSRRGLFFNFVAFLICLMGGRFVDENPVLTIVLTTGLLLLTFVRGVYLFRFEHLYPRAPARWRVQYFIVTLLGAIWWGVILSSITIKLEMRDEAPLLWLYTVVFFSTTANAFAPYQKFLSYYQFFGFIPAAGAAFFVGTYEGYMYGLLLLVFYIMLSHQCRVMSENYWEKLEATYALSRKAQTIEEEKRDRKASAQLSREFLSVLHRDLGNFLNESDDKGIEKSDLKVLYQNICDFDDVLCKNLELKNKVFNIRHEIQHLVNEFIVQAESQLIQIETTLSPSLPMRLKGDATRLAQIIRTLINIVIKDAERGVVLIEVEFLREYENAGELYVTVSRNLEKAKKKIFGETPKHELPKENISLIAAKGFADAMHGSIELVDFHGDEQKYRFNAKVDVANRAGQLDFHKDVFKGHNILLMHTSPRVVDIKRQELDALGFNVFTETQFKRAIQTLLNSYKFQTPIESVLFYVEPGNDEYKAFSNTLVEQSELKFVHKLVSVTNQQQQLMRNLGFDESEGFHFVNKPTGLFELDIAFQSIFVDSSEEIDKKACKIFVFTQSKQMLRALNNLDYDIEFVDSISKLQDQLSFNYNEILLIEYTDQSGVSDIIDNVRQKELDLRGSEIDNFLPIIGISSDAASPSDCIYETGLDDFIYLKESNQNDIKKIINYWSTLI